MKNKRDGFTLIELLVVVLIIGILAAIALPQYKKAVAKSRMTEALKNVRTFAEAQERHYLTTTIYTGDINALDISIGQMTPVTNQYESTLKMYKSGDYLYSLTNYGSAVIFYPAQGPLQFFIEKINFHSTNSYRNRLICCSYSATDKETIYDDICKNMGGTYIGKGSSGGLTKRWYKI
jgi:prepilin-type N-terminal cleavage/methylation domain-containing protein